MLRVIGILFLFAACALTGINASQKLYDRQAALDALSSYTKRLSMLMEYAPKPLSELCARLDTGPVAELWLGFARHLSDAPNTLYAWQKAMEEANGPVRALTAEDRAILEDYVRGLGSGNRETQRANAQLLEERLKAARIEAREVYSKKGRVYRSMGILCGVGLAILVW